MRTLLFLLVACVCAAEEVPPKPKEPPVSHSKTGNPKHTNALAKETSPYLLQHAHNPVNWYPWGPEAFEKAKKEDKPVFLSVGYSSCHWCHVMERESFENEAVAAILNAHFVSIKVDREERPDVDEIYMTAVQLITRHGGWPMTVFMTSDGRPFFGGTYFPPEDRGGRMGFKTLLENVNRVWRENRTDLLKDADALSEGIREYLSARRPASEQPLDRRLLENCVSELHETFDSKRGGFGSRPKFPPNNGLPLLLYLKESNSPSVKKVDAMTLLTMNQMALGGIHDHLGGGFHRYSTDERWLLPHFEKMLYDNALLSRSYAQASVLYGNADYARVARGIYEWVLREMTSPEGAFYSTLDADSEGEEGKFYVWDKKEIDQLLGPDAATFNAIFNVRPDGNFREEATGHDTGLNILHLTEPLEAHAVKLGLDAEQLRKKVDGWKATLLAVRIKRVWPGLDDKILTAWNGLMVASFARGSIWLKEPRYKDAAVKAAEFLLKNLRTPDGRWLATHRKGQSKLPAYLDDHAFLAVAFLDLFEATGDERWKKEAAAMVALMDAHFSDPQGGGYFFTADDHEKLLARTKDPIDKAIPSGNGWAAQALVRLYVLTGDTKYKNSAAKMFAEFQGLMERAPQATESLLLAVGYYLDKEGPAQQVEIKAQPKVTKGPVVVDLLCGASALRRGQKTPIALRFTVDHGWHIQSNAPAGGKIAATRFALAAGSVGSLDEPVYPEPAVLKAPQLGGDLSVFSGTVLCGALLDIPADAPLGKTVLSVRVHFQACNDKVCEAPQDVTLTLATEIVEPDARVKKMNEPVMEKLKLK
ncbi:MAG TPA: DUF255 domain-containing protein [Planctomycetota bacterium]|nr:DUF255 domain-containing protein [Planctomycetota bacterium]